MIRRLGAVGVLLSPAAWVAAEYARAYAIGGFPWIPLGNAVVTVLPLAQFASIAGVYGLSWLLATVHASFAVAAMTSGRMRVMAVALAVLLLAAPSLWGAARMREGHLTRDGETISIALIQGNVPQDEKWDPGRAADIFARYLRMTRGGRGGGRALHPVARVGDPVLLRRRRAERRPDPPHGSRDRLLDAVRFGSDRAGHAGQDLQRGVHARRSRRDLRRLPQDLPGAVRRVRPVRIDPDLRRAARRSGVGVRARASR